MTHHVTRPQHACTSQQYSRVTAIAANMMISISGAGRDDKHQYANIFADCLSTRSDMGIFAIDRLPYA